MCFTVQDIVSVAPSKLAIISIETDVFHTWYCVICSGTRYFCASVLFKTIIFMSSVAK